MKSVECAKESMPRLELTFLLVVVVVVVELV